jgi:membrane fusion protein (multidrug efflux system)
VSQVDPIYVNCRPLRAEQTRLKRDSDAGTLVLPKDGRFDVTIRFEDGTTYSRVGTLAFTDVRVNNQPAPPMRAPSFPIPKGACAPGNSCA